MKLRDRVTGTVVTPPAELQEGRYELLHSARLNGHTDLHDGDILCSDGSAECLLDGWRGIFAAAECNRDDEDRTELVARAVVAIADLSRATGELPSPLLPQEIAEISKLGELEELLERTVDKGHLHEIARRPRLDMHYREYVTQVSRARRLASGAEQHLATHTACWQQRTVGGIVPKAVLALFSEDDYSIYENRLFVRLLDRLERHLRKRLNQAGTLLDTFDKAWQFNSCDHYHRLRTSVCTIWGETFDTDETLRQLNMSRHSVEVLERLLRAMQSLKQSNLYSEIPRSCQVPNQIHLTNILVHDQHYRHIVPLWKKQLAEAAVERMPPEQRLALAMQQFLSFVKYVGIVLSRALREVRAGRDKGQWPEPVRVGHDWKLVGDATTLVFVPLVRKSNDVKVRLIGRELRIPVFLEGEFDQFDPLSVLSKTAMVHPFVLSPLDFMVEEKMVTVLRVWRLQTLFQRFGQPTTRVPTAVINHVAQRGEFVVTGAEVAVVRPVPDDVVTHLEALLQRHAGEDVHRAFLARINEVGTLSVCHSCGKEARFEYRDRRSFKATCDSCQLDWGVFEQGLQRKGKVSAPGTTSGNFSLSGRWYLEFSVSSA